MTKGERLAREAAALYDRRTLYVVGQPGNERCTWHMAEDGSVVMPIGQLRVISKANAIRLRDWLTEMLQEEDQCPPTPSS